MSKSLLQIHKECREIITRELINSESGETFACKMYHVMTDDNMRDENCLGENFNQMIHRLDEEWFESYTPSKSSNLDYYFQNYCLLLYLFVERIDFVFEVLNKDGKSKLFSDFHKNNFKTLRKINKWANFIKHPKEFVFTHWPLYYFEGSAIEKLDNNITIDTNFIYQHYAAQNMPSPVVLENKSNVYIEVPDLIKLTTEFTNELNTFFNFICENKIVHDYLRLKSTLQNFYELVDPEMERTNDSLGAA